MEGRGGVSLLSAGLREVLHDTDEELLGFASIIPLMLHSGEGYARPTSLLQGVCASIWADM